MGCMSTCDAFLFLCEAMGFTRASELRGSVGMCGDGNSDSEEDRVVAGGHRGPLEVEGVGHEKGVLEMEKENMLSENYFSSCDPFTVFKRASNVVARS